MVMVIITNIIQNPSCNTSTNLTQVFSCVQSAPFPLLYKSIFAVASRLSPLPTGTSPWQPVFDPSPPNPKNPAFLANFPTTLLAHHAFQKIPTVVGFTTDELTYLIPTFLNISSDAVLTGVARAVLPFVSLPIISTLLSLDPLSTYPNPFTGGRLSLAGKNWKRATVVASDLFEKCSGRAFAANMSLYQGVWKYRWNAALPSQISAVPEQGIVHGSELSYVFGRSYTAGNPYAGTVGVISEKGDLELSGVVQKAWLSFAAHGDPNRLGDLGGQDWPKYNKGAFTLPCLPLFTGPALQAQA
jgi:carboxylesterase type B